MSPLIMGEGRGESNGGGGGAAFEGFHKEGKKRCVCAHKCNAF